ncbi:MAG: purine-nucleoside phosphorylase [Erysipelotrichales bacterium]|nr:purine-nucleoside phosphorylase [Erysipelotrichales bacterium]
MEPLHLVTDKERIAPRVLFPGDPLRAKYIAEKFLTDYKLVNTVRNMYAYTGYYKDKLITVMGHGMGCPSVGIYAYELYHFYDVEKIIRIGSAGTYNENIKKLDVCLSTGSYSESSFAYHWSKTREKFFESSQSLNKDIVDTAQVLGMEIKQGPTLTTDTFDPYMPIDHILDDCPIKNELVAVEMEGFALMHIAKTENKQASMLVTVVDSQFEPNVIITPEMRETNLDQMIYLALESIIKD